MFLMMINTLDDSRASCPLIPRSSKTFVALVWFLVCSAPGQQQDISGLQRPEANGLVPNATLRKLLAVSSEDMSVYADAEAWEEIAGTVFGRPTAAAIVAQVKEKHPDRSHSRILATQADSARIKGKIAADPLYARWFADVRRDADRILDQLPGREPSRHVLQRRVLPLGLVYHMTGDTQYAQRAWQELKAYAHLEHWNPTTQFLDIAYIPKGFALGFDWFYDYLSREQKDILIDAVSEKALDRKEQFQYHDRGLSFHGPHITDFTRELANGTKLTISSQSGVLLSEDPEAKSPRNHATCYDRGTTIRTAVKHLQILADITSIEVSVNQGEVAMLYLVEPPGQPQPIRLTTAKDTVAIDDLKVHEMASIWTDRKNRVRMGQSARR